MDMNTCLRPDWCPNRSCTILRTVQDKVCAGFMASAGRLCINPGDKAREICALTDLDEGDTHELKNLFIAIDNMRDLHRGDE